MIKLLMLLVITMFLISCVPEVSGGDISTDLKSLNDSELKSLSEEKNSPVVGQAFADKKVSSKLNYISKVDSSRIARLALRERCSRVVGPVRLAGCDQFGFVVEPEEKKCEKNTVSPVRLVGDDTVGPVKLVGCD